VTAHIPVLHISAAYHTTSDRIAGLENGADGYLTGIEDPGVILAQVRALLRLKEVTEALASEERSSKLLKHGKDQLERFARNLLWDRDEERRELARRLNGSIRAKIGDMATLLCTEAERKSAGSAERKKFTRGVDLARQALQELSSLSRVLYAPELDVLGIEAALRDCTRRFMSRTGLRADVSISNEVSGIRNSEVAHAMLRTVEDGLDLIRRTQGTSAAIEARSAAPVLLLNMHGENARYVPALEAPRDEKTAAIEALSIGLRERARHLGGFCGVVNGKDGMTIRAGFPLTPGSRAMRRTVPAAQA
jgi:signal transduction histidine kinase